MKRVTRPNKHVWPLENARTRKGALSTIGGKGKRINLYKFVAAMTFDNNFAI